MRVKSLQFQVYSRSGCHLCEEMIEHLNVLKCEHLFDFDVVEITGDDALEALYGVKVPVLVCNGREVCHYYLDVAGLIECLKTDKD